VTLYIYTYYISSYTYLIKIIIIKGGFSLRLHRPRAQNLERRTFLEILFVFNSITQ